MDDGEGNKRKRRKKMKDRREKGVRVQEPGFWRRLGGVRGGRKNRKQVYLKSLHHPKPYIIQAMATPITVRIAWAVFPDADRGLHTGFWCLSDRGHNLRGMLPQFNELIKLNLCSKFPKGRSLQSPSVSFLGPVCYNFEMWCVLIMYIISVSDRD